MTPPPVLVLVLMAVVRLPPQKRAFIDFVVHIRNHHIALDKAVDDPLVIVSLAAFLHADGEHGFMKVGTCRRKGRRYGAADELSAIVVQRLQTSFKLTFIAFDEDGLPNLFKRQAFQCFQIFIGHFRAAVVKAFALPLRRKRDDFFLYVKMHGSSSA